MEKYEYGKSETSIVLIQMVDGHDLEQIENEVALIRDQTSEDFRFIALRTNNWNRDLSPWKAPAVFGKEGFGGGAEDTLNEVLKLCSDKSKTYYIGGYSLAGLFALWAAFQTDIFQGIAAASPSIWFPGFVDYMKEHEIGSDIVYLSLGDKEERARNPVMATVGDKMREAYRWMEERDIKCTLEWNPGNHFKDVELRMAKAFAWVVKSPPPFDGMT